MKRIALLLAIVAVITGFATPPTNATDMPGRMSYNAFAGATLCSGSFTSMASGAYRRLAENIRRRLCGSSFTMMTSGAY